VRERGRERAGGRQRERGEKRERERLIRVYGLGFMLYGLVFRV